MNSQLREDIANALWQDEDHSNDVPFEEWKEYCRDHKSLQFTVDRIYAKTDRVMKVLTNYT